MAMNGRSDREYNDIEVPTYGGQRDSEEIQSEAQELRYGSEKRWWRDNGAQRYQMRVMWLRWLHCGRDSCGRWNWFLDANMEKKCEVSLRNRKDCIRRGRLWKHDSCLIEQSMVAIDSCNGIYPTCIKEE